ncbi:hypothetical protein [Paenibacillus sp. Root444D2]|nr:hypothetical protein [Paenibacillus sp. Root444D2]
MQLVGNMNHLARIVIRPNYHRIRVMEPGDPPKYLTLIFYPIPKIV